MGQRGPHRPVGVRSVRHGEERHHLVADQQRYLDAALLTPESMRRFHGDIARIRPALIEGYVGSMLAFADFIEAEGLRLEPPKAAATTAGPLTSSARARLESVFGAPVFDEYRARRSAGWPGSVGSRTVCTSSRTPA